MTTKIAVSLPEGQVVQVKQAVARGEAASVSALVSAALADRLSQQRLAAVVQGLLAEHGRPAALDYDWASQVLGL